MFHRGPQEPTQRQDTSSHEALHFGAAGGDAEALGVLYKHAASLIYANVLRILDEPKLCDELTQKLFDDIPALAVSFDGTDGNAVHWLLAIAHQRATERLNAAALTPGTFVDRCATPHPNTGDPLGHQIAAPIASNINSALATTQ